MAWKASNPGVQRERVKSTRAMLGMKRRIALMVFSNRGGRRARPATGIPPAWSP